MKAALRLSGAASLMMAGLVLAAAPAPARSIKGAHRVFVLVVCDGLRPDMVTNHDTPNLYALAREGVRFAHHHSVYPTLTLVNAAALGTGAGPGTNGILANRMYFAPALAGGGRMADPEIENLVKRPLSMEGSAPLAALNGPHAFNGKLLGLQTVEQELAREGGYIAVVGKRGPTFLLDDLVNTVKDGRDALYNPHADYLFVSDDLVAPPAEAAKLASQLTGVLRPNDRDAFFAKVLVEKALPSAKAAADGGRPALVVLWLHQPDYTQHLDGLGTAEDYEALASSDANLGRVRGAIAGLGMESQTDLMVVSDHGFATMQLSVSLAELLTSAGLKKRADSRDVVVAHNGGSDLVYLSSDEFPSAADRRQALERIVNFVAAQEWCGPIFSREPAPGRESRSSKDYLGWIDGTFSEAWAGLLDPVRSPDLLISFLERPDADNGELTGPQKPAFALTSRGQVAVANRSKPLVRPIKGLVYADTGGSFFTTGMGIHGALGERELHSFCAATGPDFRHRYVDLFPTGNDDVAPTISELLGLLPNVGPSRRYPTARVMWEALAAGGGSGRPRAASVTAQLTLQGMQIKTTVRVALLGAHRYLEGATVRREPLGISP